MTTTDSSSEPPRSDPPTRSGKWAGRLSPEQKERFGERMREQRAQRQAEGDDSASLPPADAPPSTAAAPPAPTKTEIERNTKRRIARLEKWEAEKTRRREAKREALWDEALRKPKDEKPVASESTPPGPDTPSPVQPSSGEFDGEPVRVYSATGSRFPPLRRHFREIAQQRSLIWHLARTDLKSENYNTFFGQVWLILNPLLLAGVYVIGRSVIRPIGSAEERSFLICYLVAGVFFFQFSGKAAGTGSRSITRGKQMLLNTSVPREVFPLANTVRSIFDLIPLLITLFALRAALGQPATINYLYIPLIVLIQLTFNTGIVFGTSALTVFFRDVGNFLTFSTRLWLWTTPVLYTASEIPENMKKYLELNPLYPIFAALEQIWVGEAPSVGYLLWATAWAVPVFLAGVAFFLLKERDFAVRL